MCVCVLGEKAYIMLKYTVIMINHSHSNLKALQHSSGLMHG